MTSLSRDLAQRLVNSTLKHVDQEYPNGVGLYLTGPMTVTPAGLHPIFFGSFDWHSCVHGWWQLMRIGRIYPEFADAIHAKASRLMTSENAERERNYIEANPGFERPYGWGWFLALHQELARQSLPWATVLEPIARLLSQRMQEYLPKLTYPVRAGTHANTAFAAILALEWARQHDQQLKHTIESWAKKRFESDIAAAWIEPSGEDFLSPTLTEAVLMSKILNESEFKLWWSRFTQLNIDVLKEPVTVSDRSDGRIGHLDGLNLSRAWCWRNLSIVAEDHEEVSDKLFKAAQPHLEANYMSEHWLCSFALLALTER